MSRYSLEGETMTGIEKPTAPNSMNLNRINRKNYEEPKLPEKKEEENVC